MNFTDLLHDPSSSKVHLGMLLAFCGILGLAALRFKQVREQRERAVVKQITDVYARFPAHLLSFRNNTPRSSAVILLCITVSVLGSLFALRNYIILSNWSDGDQREFIGDHVGAIVCYKKALKVDSSLRRTHLLIGRSLLTSERVSAAVPELQLAAAGEKTDSDPAAMLGDAYQVLGKYAKASEAYLAAIAIDPVNARYYIGLGTCYEKLAMLTQAYRSYQKALDLEADNTGAHIKLGELLIRTGNINEGIGHCKRAASLAPNSSLAHYTLAGAFGRVASYNHALVEYRKAIDLDPKWIMPHYNLGVTLERMNNPGRAVEEFKTCAKMSAHSDDERIAADSARIAAIRLSQNVL